jgi:chromate reductase, NAD(P)H dehydrogenase (quinone)
MQADETRVGGAEGSAAVRESPVTKVTSRGDGRGEAADATGTDAPVKIAGIGGSLRSQSWTRALLRATAKRLPANVELTIWDSLEAIPPFNEDNESGPAHPAVAEMRDLIQRSDALLVVTPEYNGSLPGVLKNALDWASRPYGDSVLQRTPLAAVATSPLPSGGASALSDLRRVFTRIHADIVEADLTVPLVHTRIDAVNDLFSDPQLASQIEQLLTKVAEHAARVPALAGA